MRRDRWVPGQPGSGKAPVLQKVYMHKNNRLRYRFRHNIETVRANVEDSANCDEVTEAHHLALVEKLNEFELLFFSVVREVDEPKVSMGATDDPRARS